MNWDDLKFLIAVADHGSIDGAARSLNVAPRVVDSRIDALERALNCVLVSRDVGGVTIDATTGERVLAVARSIAAQVVALAREVGYIAIAGRVSVTSTASFLSHAMRAFELLRDQHPALEIDVMMSTQVVDLRHKDADLAVRMFRDQQDGLAMHKLGTMGWSLFASDKYLAGRKRGPNLLDGHQVIAYDASFGKTAGGRWIAANATDDKISTRVGGLRQALDAAARHQGVCIVPCYLAVEDKLTRVTDKVLTTNDVYAVCLAERANEPRLRVVIEALQELFVREHSAFAGS